MIVHKKTVAQYNGCSPALKKYASFCDISSLPDDVPFEKENACSNNIDDEEEEEEQEDAATNGTRSLIRVVSHHAVLGICRCL